MQQVQPQVQVQAYVIQTLWFQAVMVALSVAGAAIFILPKILKPKERK